MSEETKVAILTDQAMGKIREAVTAIEVAQAKLAGVETQAAKLRHRELAVVKASILSSLMKIQVHAEAARKAAGKDEDQ